MGKRIADIDLLKTLAIMGVVLLHSLSQPLGNLQQNSLQFLAAASLNHLARVAMPLFIFSTGFLLFRSLHKLGSDQQPKLIVGKLLPVLVPYFIWNVVYIVVPVIFGTQNLEWLNIFPNLITGSNYAHLYYIPLLFQFYFVFPLLMKPLLSGRKSSIRLVTGSFILTLAVLFVAYYQIQEPWMENFVFFVKGWGRLFPTWLFFIVLGGYAGINWDAFTQSCRRYSSFLGMGALLFLLVSLLEFRFSLSRTDLLFEQTLTSARPLVMLYCTFALLWLVGRVGLMAKSSPQLVPIYARIGNSSLGIYLAHPLLLLLGRSVLSSFGFSLTLFGGLLLFASIFISTYLLVRLANNWPPTRLIVTPIPIRITMKA